MNQQEKQKEPYSEYEGMEEMKKMAKMAMDLRELMGQQLSGKNLGENVGCFIKINGLQSYNQRGINCSYNFKIDAVWWRYFPWTDKYIVCETVLTDEFQYPLITLIINR